MLEQVLTLTNELMMFYSYIIITINKTFRMFQDGFKKREKLYFFHYIRLLNRTQIHSALER